MNQTPSKGAPSKGSGQQEVKSKPSNVLPNKTAAGETSEPNVSSDRADEDIDTDIDDDELSTDDDM